MWSSLSWRISSAAFSLARASSGKRLLRQATIAGRHRRLLLVPRLLLLCTCLILVLFVLPRSTYMHARRLLQFQAVENPQDGTFWSYIDADGSKFIQKVPSGLAVCDIYTGNWVYDSSPPIYNSTTCPFVEAGFSCLDNGRQDSEYLNWRWQPQGCDMPLFNAKEFRKKLKGLRVAFIGDSMGRTQWESLICMLMADLSDKKSVYEVNGNSITKTRPYLAVRFSEFNFTIEYFRSPYLVQEGAPPKHVPRRVHSTLKLDKLEAAASRWLEADVLVFNTGHWWTSSKTFTRGCYFQVDKSIKLGMSIQTAYQTALRTWATWVESEINLTKTQVFFRSYEPAHWEGTWRSHQCASDTKPVLNSTYSEDFPHLPVLLDIVQNMTVPLTVLNITSMSSYRRDSHVANWTRQNNAVDCGHWCLPGLPDSWNRLLYAALIQRGEGPWALH